MTIGIEDLWVRRSGRIKKEFSLLTTILSARMIPHNAISSNMNKFNNF
jgi:hypothetical protein